MVNLLIYFLRQAKLHFYDFSIFFFLYFFSGGFFFFFFQNSFLCEKDLKWGFVESGANMLSRCRGVVGMMLLENCTILFCHKLCFQHRRVWSEGGRFWLSQSVFLLA